MILCPRGPDEGTFFPFCSLVRWQTRHIRVGIEPLKRVKKHVGRTRGNDNWQRPIWKGGGPAFIAQRGTPVLGHRSPNNENAEQHRRPNDQRPEFDSFFFAHSYSRVSSLSSTSKYGAGSVLVLVLVLVYLGNLWSEHAYRTYIGLRHLFSHRNSKNLNIYTIRAAYDRSLRCAAQPNKHSAVHCIGTRIGTYMYEYTRM